MDLSSIAVVVEVSLLHAIRPIPKLAMRIDLGRTESDETTTNNAVRYKQHFSPCYFSR